MDEEREINDSKKSPKDSTSFGIDQAKEEKLEEIVSDRVTEEIEDDLTALRNQQHQSPLSFYLRIGDSYCFSFDKSKAPALAGRFCIILPVILAQSLAVAVLSSVPSYFRDALLVLFGFQLFFYTCLFCLDPGTLVEDEDEKYEEDRYLCQNCRLYRYSSTRHCSFCRKCVRGYDHHCAFFGKCIGRHNFIIFCLFALTSFVAGMTAMGTLAFTFIQHL